MKEKIYIKDWLLLKPYKKNAATDLYYLKVSNLVHKEINKNKISSLFMYLDKKDIKLLSCFLTSYFEDIISETNIWNSFTNIHQKLYNKRLPFYDTESYYENEVNIQDITFLIWYFLNTIRKDKFISPYNNFIEDIAQDIYLILEDEYEYAPENEKLKSFYELEITEDFYRVRLFLNRIFTKTYLFYTDTMLNLLDQEIDIIEKNMEDQELTFNYLKENLDEFVFKLTSRLLNLHSKEWAAEILGKNHPMTKEILNLSPRVCGLFLYKGQDQKTVFLEHIASSKKFNLLKESFDGYTDLKEIDTIVYLGLVQWKNQWWFSGISFQMPFNADIILDEKASIESRKQVDFLDFKKDNQKIKEITAQQQNAFLEYTKGSQIHFLTIDEISTFLEGYFEYYNNSLKLNKSQREKALQRAKKEGLLLKEEEITFNNDENTALIYFNPISGIEIAFGINSAFPLNENPFYNEAESYQDFLELLISTEYSKELVLYCIEKCKDNLSFFKTIPEKYYEEDLDFFLRFYKGPTYHTKHNITLTGKNL